jgi:hypothetical protein
MSRQLDADDNKTRGSKQSGAGATASLASTTRTVSYVVNRPYVAGEHPDIVQATVVRETGNPDVLDLKVGDVEFKDVPRSKDYRPGTWVE